MTTYNVGYIVGSLAKASINRKLAKALIKVAPEKLKFHEISFADLPLYSYDYDADYPAVANDFKAAIKGSDAILIVTPEYNRSIPGGLKNAIDWASRPYGTNSFANKPTAVIGASPGAIGTAVGQQDDGVGQGLGRVIAQPVQHPGGEVFEEGPPGGHGAPARPGSGERIEAAPQHGQFSSFSRASASSRA